MGKRKNTDKSENEAEEEEATPARGRRTSALSAPDSETDSPASRSSGRERKVVKAFDPVTTSQASPSVTKKSKGAKKCEPTVADYTPDEKESFGTFIVQVENEWRDVKGFRVFEVKGAPKELKDGKVQFNKVREWYCSKQVEPPGGFKPGQQGFCPAGQNWGSMKFLTTSYVEVQVAHKIMDWGTYTRKFIEIVGEQEKVAEAYEKHPADGNDLASEPGEDEAEDDDEQTSPAPKSRSKSERKSGASPKSPRPQSAYMVFVNAKRDEIMAEHPGITMPQLGKKCGEIWRSMSTEDREEFVVKAAALKEEYKQKAPTKSSGNDDEESPSKPAAKRNRKSKGSAKASKAEGDEAEEDAGAEASEGAEPGGSEDPKAADESNKDSAGEQGGAAATADGKTAEGKGGESAGATEGDGTAAAGSAQDGASAATAAADATAAAATGGEGAPAPEDAEMNAEPEDMLST